ncbi:MAG: M48 family metallopeptidase [Xanthomonadales bacterium]|nr:M48 family metallopeptidase [Xanthomonadales bacterium]
MTLRRTPPPRRLQLPGEDGGIVTVQVFEPARARHLRLSIGRDGPRLSKPGWVPWEEAEAFVQSRRQWLLARLRDARDYQHLLQLPMLVPGARGWLTLRGQRLALRVATGARPSLELAPEDTGADTCALLLTLPGREPAVQRRLAAGCLRAFLEQAMRADCARLLGHYAPLLARAPARLRLRPLHSLWGSLSGRDHMSLDLALILAPPPLLEYVLVHELCHLFERNHGPGFWARVAALLPDYRQREHALNDQGAALKAGLAALLAYSRTDADDRSAADSASPSPPA